MKFINLNSIKFKTVHYLFCLSKSCTKIHKKIHNPMISTPTIVYTQQVSFFDHPMNVFIDEGLMSIKRLPHECKPSLTK